MLTDRIGSVMIADGIVLDVELWKPWVRGASCDNRQSAGRPKFGAAKIIHFDQFHDLLVQFT